MSKENCRFCGRPKGKGHRCWEPTIKHHEKAISDKVGRNRGNVWSCSNSGRKIKAKGNIRRSKAKMFANETQLFDYLWNSRPHISEISGKPLLPIGHPQWHWQFLHVLPKGLYGRYRLNSRNIVLALPNEHTYQDKATNDPQWAWFFLLKDFLKAEYHGSMDNKRFTGKGIN